MDSNSQLRTEYKNKESLNDLLNSLEDSSTITPLKTEYNKKDAINYLLATLDKQSGITSISSDVFFYLFLLYGAFYGYGIKAVVIYLAFMAFFIAMRSFKKCPIGILSYKQLKFIESSPILSIALKSAIASSNKFYFHRFYNAVEKHLKETESNIRSLEEQKRLEIEKVLKDNE